MFQEKRHARSHEITKGTSNTCNYSLPQEEIVQCILQFNFCYNSTGKYAAKSGESLIRSILRVFGCCVSVLPQNEKEKNVAIDVVRGWIIVQAGLHYERNNIEATEVL